jgi:hypothetical protein
MPLKKSKLRKPWKDCEHLATPDNMMKYEFACCKDCVYRRQVAHHKPRALRSGPVKWLMKDGKELNS